MNHLYFRTRYLISALKLSDTPPDHGFEAAFAGRSNAGKSSAINAICRQKTLARTSKTPGRTQMLNFFEVDEQRRLVDLPGYGYAKVPDAMQKNWRKSMETYLLERQSLAGVFLLMDIRHPLTDFDWQMITWCSHHKRPLHIALTKADKLGRGAARGMLLKVGRELHSRIPDIPITLQLFSVLHGVGVEEAHDLLDTWLGYAQPERIGE
ncbi:YihA family ribosome biogenesis GTP-binding protein [Candidatus Methylospira mobilis]|uniref:Probable GTP-binding protein EngB n=1 Tax=Candidatus Methylospira mobilis TaxID=1808979 RepID=A0A5Q0BH84_9GAMM|nr:ribosome biogenesis GTP-binding protein YihA/YsxC [Candidatus Methylospira mobilis]QFY43193.1 YihA family ribosome biogenesis GTP-binding protein [Candidatus Methylospira mobilis]WNV03602.1 ribosome biogenesis GTP-binding protein YihA/YsxC [Candidatus Methylospira mobilis]